MEKKYNKFKGLFTDAESRALSSDYFPLSFNFKHRETQLKADIINAQQMTLPTLLSGWVWEDIVHAKISNDKYARTISPAEYDITILIAKKTSNYQRQFIYSLDSNPTDWTVLQADGTAGVDFPTECSKLSTIKITSEFLIPEEEGTVKWINDRGTVKFYMSHDSFWFGFINRTIYLGGSSSISPFSFYFDRLSEPIKLSNTGEPLVNNLCPDNRRLAVTYSTEKTTSGTIIVTGETATFREIGPEEDGDVIPYVLINDQTGETIGLPEGADGAITYNINGFDISVETWYFLPYNNGNEVLVPVAEPLIKDSDLGLTDALLVTTDTYSTITNPTVNFGSWTGVTMTGTFFRIPRATMLSTSFSINSGTQNIDDAGFTTNTTIESIIVTGVLDRKSEIIIHSNNTLYSHTGNYAIKVSNVSLPTDINLRITNLRFYAKKTDGLDYEMYRDFDLISNTTALIPDFYIADAGGTGILLSQNIGYAVDIKDPEDYEVITGFDEMNFHNGFATGIWHKDRLNIYAPAVGNGGIMTDVFYKNGIIELPGIYYPIAIAGVGNKIVVVTKTKMYIIMVQQISGVLTYEVIESINRGINNRTDLISLENGFIINTKEGIFYSDGLREELISEPINDIIKDNYDNAIVHFNEVKQELYFLILGETIYYRFRFDEKKWESVGLTGSAIVLAKKMEVDLDGYPYYISDSNIFKGMSSGSYALTAYIRTKRETFDAPSFFKKLNSLRFLYKGTATVYIYLYGSVDSSTNTGGNQNEVFSFTLDNSAVKQYQLINIALSQRYPFIDMEIYLSTSDTSFELSEILFNYDVIYEQEEEDV